MRARGQAGRHLNVKTCVTTDEQGSRAGAQPPQRGLEKEEGEGSAWERSWNCLTISSNKYLRETE